MTNEYGLDTSYFTSKIDRIVKEIDRYTPDEFAREMARMAKTADSAVLSEPEFSTSTVIKHAASVTIHN